jgi:hypothetical protein
MRLFAWSFVAAVIFLGVFVPVACSPRCIEGISIRCACEGGRDGVQVCLASGAFDLCRCGGSEAPTDGGSEVVAEEGEKKPESTAEIATEKLPEMQFEAVQESASEPKTEDAKEEPTETPQELEGAALFQRLLGLWVGAAGRTPLGNFPIMMMDMRPASPHVLFSRADLDAANNLRFAFSVETHAGKDVLVYRNGGYFLGILRDSRTSLIAHDPAKAMWRFCSIQGGCDYIDAIFTFPAEGQLILDVKVRGRDHLYWQAERRETRPQATPFPKDLTSQGTGNAPFPPMPKVNLTLMWTQPLAQEAEAWFLFSTMPCNITFQCQPSRSIRVTVPAGSIRAETTLEQAHTGKFFVNAFLDRNKNAAMIFRPDSGDGIAQLDTALTIEEGKDASLSLFVFYDIP